MVAGKYVRTTEIREKGRLSKLGHAVTEETRRKISVANTGRVQSLEERQKRMHPHEGPSPLKNKTYEEIGGIESAELRRSKLRSRRFKLTPEQCYKVSIGKMGHVVSLETRAVLRKASRTATQRTWDSYTPEERAKRVAAVLAASRKKPTSIELRTQKVVDELRLPYKYVGNGKLIIAGRNPDFANTNGQKKLIEAYGCFWHCCPICGKRPGKREIKQREDVETLEGYAALGNKTLVIWEHELSNPEAVKEKLLEFERT